VPDARKAGPHPGVASPDDARERAAASPDRALEQRFVRAARRDADCEQERRPPRARPG